MGNSTYTSLQITLHQWRRNSPPTITMQRDTHFHQQAITRPARNPLQWITKHQKHITYKQTKPTKCRKEQQNLNFRRPQPLMMPNRPVVCHLLPFIHSILGFPNSNHPQKETWHYFSVTTISEQLLMRKMQIKVVNLFFKSFSRTVSEQIFLAWKMQILFQ